MHPPVADDNAGVGDSAHGPEDMAEGGRGRIRRGQIRRRRGMAVIGAVAVVALAGVMLSTFGGRSHTAAPRPPVHAPHRTPLSAHPTVSRRPVAADGLVRRATLRGHANAVDIVFSADGRLLAGCSIDAGSVWELPSGRKSASFSPDRPGSLAPCPSAFSREGSMVALLESRIEHSTIRLWDLAEQETVRTFEPGPAYISVVGFSADNQSLIAGGREPRWWDVASGRTTTARTEHRAFTTALSPDRTVLATAGNEDIVQLWDVASRRRIATMRPLAGGDLHDFAFGPGGRTLATVGSLGSGEEEPVVIRLWDVASARTAATLTATGCRQGCSIAYGPDSRLLVTVSGSGLDPGTARLWDLPSRQVVATLTGVHSAAFSPDGRTLATGDRAGTVRLWGIRHPPPS